MMKTNRKRLAWLGASLLVGAAVGSAQLFRGAPHSAPGASKRSEAAELIRLGGSVGSTWRYDLELVSESNADGAMLAKTTLHASLDVTTVAAAAGSLQILGHFEQPRLEQSGAVEGSVATMPVEPIEAQLAQAFQYSLAATGAIREVRVSPKAEAFASHLLRSVLAYTQVVGASSVAARIWDSEESDPLGRFTAHYTREPASGKVFKEKRSLIETYNQAGYAGLRAQSISLERSSNEISVDAQGAITGMTLDEILRINGVMLLAADGLLAKTHFTLANGRALPNASPITASVLGSGRPVEAPTAVAGHDYWADLNRISGRNIKDIVTELQQLRSEASVKRDGSKPDGGKRARLYIAASALLRRDPAAVKDVVELIRGKGVDASFMIQALGDAGSDFAATALTDLLKSSKGIEQTRSLLRALGSAREPSTDTVAAMRSLFPNKQVGGLARLMVGAMSYNSRDRAPDVSGEAASALVQQLDQETDAMYIADTLRALGNSGGPEALAAARKYVGHESPIVRAAAAQAVRRVVEESADPLLVALMADDVVLVRNSALNAVLDRSATSTLLAGVTKVTKLDVDPSVRREGVRVLVDWSARVPTARDVLVWVAANDENEKLRALAMEGLHRHD